MILAIVENNSPAIALLIVVGIAVLGNTLLRGSRLLFRKLSGWKALTQRFPVKIIHMSGEKYRAHGECVNFRFRHSGLYKPYLIELAQEGLLVTASFASGSPIFIPWSSVGGVSVIDLDHLGTAVGVTVDYEKIMRFELPNAALTTIQKNILAERFQKVTSSPLSTVSLFETRNAPTIEKDEPTKSVTRNQPTTAGQTLITKPKIAPTSTSPGNLPVTISEWQSATDQLAGINESTWIPSKGYANNSQNVNNVYKFYQTIYEANPNLLWAGLAAVAGSNDVLWTLKILNSLAVYDPTDDLPITEDTLLTMQQNIYKDLAWQQVAYQFGRIDAVTNIYLSGGITPENYQTWLKIDNGIQTGISKQIVTGNYELLYREQFMIVTPGYVKLRNLPFPVPSVVEDLFVSNPIPGGAQFDGDITDFQQRMSWMGDQVFYPFSQMSPGDRLNLVAKPIMNQ
ncbi:MAG TPA: hypothetical protein VMG59_12150 [Phycisphaerae bacterium]|nr:hypothetical protein [Phycisphaerae bacterium]